jgi:hypothetical protein
VHDWNLDLELPTRQVMSYSHLKNISSNPIQSPTQSL